MLFNSWQYVVFLPVVLLLYWVIPNRFRWTILLIASYYFYMSWNAKLIVLIGTTTIVSYIAAIFIEKAKSEKERKAWLALGCGISLLILFFYKYFNFFSVNVSGFLRSVSLPVDDFTIQVMLPVGISFYTFQTLSYVIDVYSGALKAEKHFGIYALYVSFFPQLVAGPIERATNLLPQFHREHVLQAEKCAWGLRMIVFGLFKKMYIADFFANYVNRVYNNLENRTPMTLVLATVLFSIQIYCDFSGYSDIALGSAKLLDFDLMQNFNVPYFSKTIQEFWKRWHISLSSWFESYLFTPFVWNNPMRKIPFVGRYFEKPPVLFGIALVFITSGLWHGAAWTFIIWGAFHGFMQIFSNLTKKSRKKLRKRLHIKDKSAWYQAWQMAFVFGLVCCSYVFFRANTIADAFFILSQFPKAIYMPLTNFVNSLEAMEIIPRVGARMLLGISILLCHDIVQYRHGDVFVYLAKQKQMVRFFITYLVTILVLWTFLSLPEDAVAEFIYFQF